VVDEYTAISLAGSVLLYTLNPISASSSGRTFFFFCPRFFNLLLEGRLSTATAPTIPAHTANFWLIRKNGCCYQGYR
jgi:hypothetical protein